MSRFFRALRSITLPRGLVSGPGATNIRLEPGQVATCDDDACAREQRYVNGRVRAGDIEELDALPADAIEGAPVPASAGETLGMTLAGPAKKGR